MKKYNIYTNSNKNYNKINKKKILIKPFNSIEEKKILAKRIIKKISK